jgi:electron transfer flavoprotein beta subunit
MKAKKKPLEEIDAAEFGIALEPRIKVLKTAEPGERQAGVRVGSVAELVDKLRNEAGVLQ